MDGSFNCLSDPTTTPDRPLTFWETVQLAVGETLTAPINDDVDDPAVWGKVFPLYYELYLRTADMQRTRHGGSEAEPRTPSSDELQLIEMAADIARIAIEQQRAYQALRHSEARNEAILRAIPDWMFLTTVEGIFLDYHVRDASKLHVQPSAFLGRRISDVLPPPVAEPLTHAFARASASDEAEKVEYTRTYLYYGFQIHAAKVL